MALAASIQLTINEMKELRELMNEMRKKKWKPKKFVDIVAELEEEETSGGGSPDLSKLTKRVALLESKEANDVANINGRFQSLSNKMDGLSGQVGSLSSTVTGMSLSLTHINTRLTNLEGDVSTVVYNLNGLTGKVNDNKNAITIINTTIDTLRSRMNDLNAQFGSLVFSLSNVTPSIAALERDVEMIQDSLSKANQFLEYDNAINDYMSKWKEGELENGFGMPGIQWRNKISYDGEYDYLYMYVNFVDQYTDRQPKYFSDFDVYRKEMTMDLLDHGQGTKYENEKILFTWGGVGHESESVSITYRGIGIASMSQQDAKAYGFIGWLLVFDSFNGAITVFKTSIDNSMPIIVNVYQQGKDIRLLRIDDTPFVNISYINSVHLTDNTKLTRVVVKSFDKIKTYLDLDITQPIDYQSLGAELISVDCRLMLVKSYANSIFEVLDRLENAAEYAAVTFQSLAVLVAANRNVLIQRNLFQPTVQVSIPKMTGTYKKTQYFTEFNINGSLGSFSIDMNDAKNPRNKDVGWIFREATSGTIGFVNRDNLVKKNISRFTYTVSLQGFNINESNSSLTFVDGDEDTEVVPFSDEIQAYIIPFLDVKVGSTLGTGVTRYIDEGVMTESAMNGYMSTGFGPVISNQTVTFPNSGPTANVSAEGPLHVLGDIGSAGLNVQGMSSDDQLFTETSSVRDSIDVSCMKPWKEIQAAIDNESSVGLAGFGTGRIFPLQIEQNVDVLLVYTGGEISDMSGTLTYKQGKDQLNTGTIPIFKASLTLPNGEVKKGGYCRINLNRSEFVLKETIEQKYPNRDDWLKTNMAEVAFRSGTAVNGAVTDGATYTCADTNQVVTTLNGTEVDMKQLQSMPVGLYIRDEDVGGYQFGKNMNGGVRGTMQTQSLPTIMGSSYALNTRPNTPFEGTYENRPIKLSDDFKGIYPYMEFFGAKGGYAFVPMDSSKSVFNLRYNPYSVEFSDISSGKFNDDILNQFSYANAFPDQEQGDLQLVGLQGIDMNMTMELDQILITKQTDIDQSTQVETYDAEEMMFKNALSKVKDSLDNEEELESELEAQIDKLKEGLSKLMGGDVVDEILDDLEVVTQFIPDVGALISVLIQGAELIYNIVETIKDGDFNVMGLFNDISKAIEFLELYSLKHSLKTNSSDYKSKFDELGQKFKGFVPDKVMGAIETLKNKFGDTTAVKEVVHESEEGDADSSVRRQLDVTPDGDPISIMSIVRGVGYAGQWIYRKVFGFTIPDVQGTILEAEEDQWYDPEGIRDAPSDDEMRKRAICWYMSLLRTKSLSLPRYNPELNRLGQNYFNGKRSKVSNPRATINKSRVSGGNTGISTKTLVDAMEKEMMIDKLNTKIAKLYAALYKPS